MISAPHLNPVTFRPVTTGTYAYNTHHFDDWFHWEQYQKENPNDIYFQPHLANSNFHLQFESDQLTLNYKILNCKGVVLNSGIINSILSANIVDADYFEIPNPNQIKTNYNTFQTWMIPGTIITISGSSNPANNGTYTLGTPAFTGLFSGFRIKLTTPIPDPTASVGTVTYGFSAQQRFIWDFNVPGLGIAVNDGDVVYICVDDGNGNALITEPIQLFTNLPDNVIEFKVDGERNDLDWIFYNNGDPLLPTLRPFFLVEAHIKEFNPASEAERYDDQILDHTTLSATPYRTFKLFIGDDYGVPPYVIDKINRYLSADHVYMDDKEFTVNGKAKIDVVHTKFYGFVGASVDIRETNNKFQIKI